MQIGKRIHARRRALTLTQEELARETSVTHQHISRIEGGQAVPSLELLVKLARALGVSTDFLLTGEDTAPTDIKGAVRAEGALAPAAKKHLIGLIEELRSQAQHGK